MAVQATASHCTLTPPASAQTMHGAAAAAAAAAGGIAALQQRCLPRLH